jgi:ABC-type Na+ efflux pump permease subunit
MTKSTATGILKLSAILIIFLGLILLSQVLGQIHTANGALFKPLLNAYVFPIAVLFWGMVLYLLSPKLGKMVVGKKD